MAELTTIARPYAEALFQLARESGTLTDWSVALDKLALIASNENARDAVSSPQFTVSQLQALLIDLLGNDVRPEVSNFIWAVLENRRFAVLPAIAEQYETLKSASEGQTDVKVESAFPLSDSQFAELTAVLSQQFNRKVNAEVTIDTGLIGGVKITIGDLVVDASVRGKLNELAASLKS